MEGLIAQIKQIIAVFGLKIAAAIAIFAVGQWIAKVAKQIVKKIMEKGKIEATLVSFATNLIYYAILTFVVLASLNQVGIETASLIAILGAAGLAVGLALQGSLANLAAGVLLIIFRPFRVNDFIEIGDVEGTVLEIEIFTTTLKTLDNKTITIPNAKLTSDNIINHTYQPIRRIDVVVGVGYDSDLDKVKSVIASALAEDKRILTTPPPIIAAIELADNSVNFAVRPWVKTPDYWPVYFDVLERIKKHFDAEGINIPFPQRTVYLEWNHKIAGLEEEITNNK